MKKITFEILVENNPYPKSVDIEFEPTGEDLMEDAIKALKDYMSKTYPNLEYHPHKTLYQISYWWWE